VRAVVRRATVCAILAGCSGGSSGRSDGGPLTGPIAIDDFPSAVATAICQRAVDCSFYPDVATCIATNVARNIPADAAYVVKHGMADYDPVAAAACVEALPRGCWNQGGDWFLTELGFLETAICRRPFTGKVPGGGACCSGYECASQLCGVTGTCDPIPLSPLGGPCGTNPPSCDFDLSCSPEGKCEAHLPVGANCAAQDWQLCEEPAGCPTAGGGSPMPGICFVLPDRGEACDGWPSGRCLRLDDYCDASTGVCTPQLQPGAACSVPGAPCVRYADCTNGVCTSLSGPGGACTPDRPCITGFPCVNNVCTLPAAPTLYCQP